MTCVMDGDMIMNKYNGQHKPDDDEMNERLSDLEKGNFVLHWDK